MAALSYATRDDVLARAGRVGGAFSVAGRRPSLTDVDAFLAAVAADVDEAIRARGFDPAGLDANAQAGLKDLVAYGALARALRALADRSPQVLELLTEADSVWGAAMGDGKTEGSIAAGTFPVIAALLAGQGGGPVVSAGAFWEDEPDFGRPYQVLGEYYELRGTNLAPGFSRGQKL